MNALRFVRTLPAAVARSTSVFLRDVGNGLLVVSHNSLALIGLVVVAVGVFAATRVELREAFESHALSWLQQRHEERSLADGNLLGTLTDPTAVSRATAADPGTRPRRQAAVAQWISRRYKVAPEPISRLVAEAFAVGARARVDPTLILAIMALESSFNPFAQSTVGAQGLMQVMTSVHDDKYESFGGTHAAFDPITNLRVGVQVLRDSITRAGTIEGGLRFYVGAANLPDDGGYASKVLAEQSYLKQIAAGQSVSPNVRLVPVVTRAPEPTPAGAGEVRDDARLDGARAAEAKPT